MAPRKYSMLWFSKHAIYSFNDQIGSPEDRLQRLQKGSGSFMEDRVHYNGTTKKRPSTGLRHLQHKNYSHYRHGRMHAVDSLYLLLFNLIYNLPLEKGKERKRCCLEVNQANNYCGCSAHTCICCARRSSSGI